MEECLFKRFKCFRNFNEFSIVFILVKKGVRALMHVYVWEHIKSALTTEPLNGCLRNLVGMKCSLPGTCINMFGHIYPGADPGRGKIGFKKTSSSDRKATATN